MNPTRTPQVPPELIVLCAHGDREAFRKVYEATHDRVRRAVRRIVGDEHVADEVVSDTYLQAWRSAAEYAPSRASVLTWLVMMARCRALDAVRGYARRAARQAPLEAANDPSSEESVTGNLEAREAANSVVDSINALPPKQAEAIRTAFLGGRTHRETAAVLDEPLGTIKTRLRLGLASLRGSLDSLV